MRPSAAQNPDQVLTDTPADSEPSTVPTPGPRIYHGACGKWWTGATRGHCGQCHETFTSGAFDAHQRINQGVITCSTEKLTPHVVGFGILWSMPGRGYWAARNAGTDVGVYGEDEQE